jgi:hypothetical protein
MQFFPPQCHNLYLNKSIQCHKEARIGELTHRLVHASVP